MCKQLTAAFLLLAFVAQTFKGPFILVDYYANTAAFAKNCVNKAIAKMHCNGKCQLMKQLLEEQNKEQQDAANKLEIKIALLAPKPVYPVLPASSVIVSIIIPREINTAITAISPDIFHPPQA